MTQVSRDKRRDPPDILRRLERLFVCEDGCEGRCRECPQDVVRDAITEITNLRAAHAQQVARPVCASGPDCHTPTHCKSLGRCQNAAPRRAVEVSRTELMLFLDSECSVECAGVVADQLRAKFLLASKGESQEGNEHG